VLSVSLPSHVRFESVCLYALKLLCLYEIDLSQLSLDTQINKKLLLLCLAELAANVFLKAVYEFAEFG
ncbi:hypothetical protein Ancab_007773, partial [Ancistrocladus abbreviatus]